MIDKNSLVITIFEIDVIIGHNNTIRCITDIWAFTTSTIAAFNYNFPFHIALAPIATFVTCTFGNKYYSIFRRCYILINNTAIRILKPKIFFQ